MTALPDALRQAYASNVTGEQIREGVTFYHPKFTRQRHVTAEPRQWSADDGSGATITYIPAPLSLTGTGQDESGAGRMPAILAAVPEVVTELVRASGRATDPITMILRRYLGASLIPVQVQTYSLTGASVNTEDSTVSVVAAIPALTDSALFPRLFFRASTYPGLDRK